MLNPTEILPRHLTPLQAALMKWRSKLDAFRVNQLYGAARALFHGRENLSDDPSIIRSRFVAGDIVVAVCTDAASGVFVQLAGSKADGDAGLALTFGQKYCQEGRETVRGGSSTKIW